MGDAERIIEGVIVGLNDFLLYPGGARPSEQIGAA
jgi:hypothetical protein